MTSKDLTRTIE